MKKSILLIFLVTLNFFGLKAQIAWPQNGSNIYYNGGNVGIGTSSPESTLSVQKSILGGRGGEISIINLAPFATGNEAALNFGLENSTYGNNDGNAQIKARINGLSGASTDLIFSLWSGSSFNEYMKIGSNGNVGIGTTTPSALLHLYKSGANDVRLRIEGANSQYWRGIDFGNSGGTYGSIQHENNFGELRFSTGYAGWGGFQTFYTDGSEKMRILSNGNIGIGTITPNTKLTILASSTSNQVLFNIKSGYTAGGNQDIFKVTQTASDGYVDVCNAANGVANVHLSGYNNINCPTYILGNIGIGTTTPSNSLTLSKMSNGANLARITFDGQTGDANNTINGGVEFHNDNYNYYSGIYGYRGDFSNQAGIQLKASSGTAMTILPNMNIGIGVTNPQYKLAVEGTIAAREVKVTAEAWADFVFHPSYKLRTLGEVEQFIKTNSHLPEIPTTAEVKENGVSLGEMNTKLLQKVEELTLYLIDQQKQLNEVKMQNEKLAKEIEKLKK